MSTLPPQIFTLFVMMQRLNKSQELSNALLRIFMSKDDPLPSETYKINHCLPCKHKSDPQPCSCCCSVA